MTARSVSAKIGKGDNASDPVTISYDFGDNLKEAAARFGEDVVFAHWLSSATISLQSRMRAAMAEDVEAGRKPDANKVRKALEGYKIGIKAEPKDRVEKARGIVSKMSDEEKKRLRELLAA